MQGIYLNETNAEVSIVGKLMRQFFKINKNSLWRYQEPEGQIQLK
jgi:hypothetical protein